MSAIRQIFADRAVGLRNKLSDFGWLTKSGHVEIGRPFGAVLVLAIVSIGLLTAYWLAASSLSALQLNYNARQDLLDVLYRRRHNAVGAMKHARDRAQDPFLTAATETLAAASLDDKIRRIAANVSGTVASSHPEVDRDSQSAGNKIEIKAVIDGKIDALQALLFRLETGAPAVFVEELSLETKSGDTDGGAPATDPALHMAATFVAYWHPQARPEARR